MNGTFVKRLLSNSIIRLVLLLLSLVLLISILSSDRIPKGFTWVCIALFVIVFLLLDFWDFHVFEKSSDIKKRLEDSKGTCDY